MLPQVDSGTGHDPWSAAIHLRGSEERVPERSSRRKMTIYNHERFVEEMIELLTQRAVQELVIYAYFNRNSQTIVYTPSFTIPRVLPNSAEESCLAQHGLHGYCDASWLLRSPAGYIVMMLGGPIDWGSKLIRVICHSSSEAEIAAGCMLGKRSVFIRQFLSEFNVKFDKGFIILIDNSAALDISKKLGVSARTAHFLRWQHYLRYLALHGHVKLIFVPTADQLADMLTKVLDVSTMTKFLRMIVKA